MKRYISDFIDSLRNDSQGYSQRKLAVASVMTSVFVANLVYIYNCYQKNLFDSTFILWLTTMIGFVSATFVALYGTKAKQDVQGNS
jgi:hypothetical protein